MLLLCVSAFYSRNDSWCISRCVSDSLDSVRVSKTIFKSSPAEFVSAEINIFFLMNFDMPNMTVCCWYEFVVNYVQIDLVPLWDWSQVRVALSVAPSPSTRTTGLWGDLIACMKRKGKCPVVKPREPHLSSLNPRPPPPPQDDSFKKTSSSHSGFTFDSIYRHSSKTKKSSRMEYQSPLESFEASVIQKKRNWELSKVEKEKDL